MHLYEIKFYTIVTLFTPATGVFQVSACAKEHYTANPTQELPGGWHMALPLLTAGPGSPGMPLSPRCPGIPTIPLWPVVPAGPGGPSGPWNPQRRQQCHCHVSSNKRWEPAWSQRRDSAGTYGLPVIPRITLVSRATRRPSWPSISHTAMRTWITTKTWGTFFSWLTNRPSWPWGSLKKWKHIITLDPFLTRTNKILRTVFQLTINAHSEANKCEWAKSYYHLIYDQNNEMK